MPTNGDKLPLVRFETRGSNLYTIVFDVDGEKKENMKHTENTLQTENRCVSSCVQIGGHWSMRMY